MAKMRTKMTEQGLTVPPPLRRGGGISRNNNNIPITIAPISSAPRVRASSSKKGGANTKPGKTAPTKRKKGKKANDLSEEDEDEDDDWKDDDSDADGDYGKPRVKRTKLEARLAGKRQSATNSQEEDEGNAKMPKVVGAGEAWLDLEDDGETETVIQNPSNKKSLVVTLLTNPQKANHGKNIKVEVDKDGAAANSYSAFVGDQLGQGIAAPNMELASGYSFDEIGYPYVNHDSTYFSTAPQRNPSVFDDVNAEFDAQIAAANNPPAVPYQIQTSFPNYTSTASSSNFNQTPAGTSAGADFGNGYFDSGNAAQFAQGAGASGSLYNSGIDFNTNNDTDPFIGAGVASNGFAGEEYNFTGDFDYFNNGTATNNFAGNDYFGTGDHQEFRGSDYFGNHQYGN